MAKAQKSVTAHFATLIYNAPLLERGGAALGRELLKECRQIRERDAAGQAWSRTGYPGGYTSYGSLDKLHRMTSTFARLQQALDRHARRYAQALDWSLGSGRLLMTDCWINVMPRGTAHSFHLHPQSVISGTYYVSTPRGSSPLKFEDPRLSNLMAAPPRKAGSAQRPHLSYPARAGEVILFESWLRHEVPPSRIDAERISISFNYHYL